MTTDPIGPRLTHAVESLEYAGEAGLPALAALYADEVSFQDPIQQLQGRAAFIEMNRKALAGARLYRLMIDELVETPDNLFASWRMVYQPKLGPKFTISGTTHARLRDGLIVEQRDYWDLLGSLVGNLPGVGTVYNRLVGLLG